MMRNLYVFSVFLAVLFMSCSVPSEEQSVSSTKKDSLISQRGQFIFTTHLTKHYKIAFVDSVKGSGYCNACLLENGKSYKLSPIEEDTTSIYCGFTGNFKNSPDNRFTILERIESGYVEDGKEKVYHENYFCWLIDLENKKVLNQYQSLCDGNWTKDSKWVSGEDTLNLP